jgi:oligoribonuclease NrnB/cAMP/cGMP phosphodiesterase (DHH superfamily)
MINETPLVLYHANCSDGFCAAWVVRLIYPHADFVPVQYGKEPPDVYERKVLMVDFCYPLETMRTLMKFAVGIRVIDHHATSKDILGILHSESKDELNRNVFCTWNDQHSGARLTWDHFHAPEEKRPWLVDYTEDRDLWHHRLPYTNEINAYIQAMPFDFAIWDEMASMNALDFVASGRALLLIKQKQTYQAVKNAHDEMIGGYKVKATNTGTNQSEVGQELAKGQPFAATYVRIGDGKWVWSLRSDENGLDVSQIAKAYGGGGHVHAAGFTSWYGPGKLHYHHAGDAMLATMVVTTH